MVQGPLLWDFHSPHRLLGIENGALTTPNPPSIRRVGLWKKAAVRVEGRPDWLFIKLHCHGMDPKQKSVSFGESLRAFLRELVEGAEDRRETIHFVTAREMVNIILAACDGKAGNPRDYRDYRLQRTKRRSGTEIADQSHSEAVQS